MLVLEGRAFFRGGLEPLALGVEDGRIVRIAKALRGDERRTYGDRLILPGGVDLHVHFRDPGAPHDEDFFTGTAGAAVGGITTVFDMPNTRPPVTTRDAYTQKLARVRRRANVDFGLYAAARSASDVERFSDIAPAAKMYMAHSAGAVEVTDPAVWRDVVAAAAATNVLLVCHAEADTKFGPGEARGLEAYDRQRPPEAEAEAIRALDTAARAAGGARVHIAHVTSLAALGALEGTALTAEATPHHLFLDHSATLDARGKVNPPLRSASDRQALWEALRDGRIDCVASDHAPRTVEEKAVPFPTAPPGVPGVETMLPLLLRLVKAGDLSLARFVEVTSSRPAAIMGIPGGALEVGAEASVLVVDPRRSSTIRGRDLHSRAGWSPFEGMEAIFPDATYLRGELVAQDRELVAERLGQPIAAPKRS